MNNFRQNITETIKLLMHLEQLAQCIPEEVIQRWDACWQHPEIATLVQFHWRGEKDDENREPSARRLARVFGGTWQRKPDGNWEGDVPIPAGIMLHAQHIQVILHKVVLQKPHGPIIDLSEAEERA